MSKKRGKLVKYQKTRIKNSSETYWDWAKSHNHHEDGQIIEEVKANPDFIPSETSYNALQDTIRKADRVQDIQTRWRRRKLKNLFKSGHIRRTLTLIQFKVFSQYLQDIPVVKIAENLGVSESNIVQHLNRVIKKLRKKFNKTS